MIPFRWVGGIFTGLALVAGLSFGGYEAYWAIAGHNANHQNTINHTDTQYQSSLISQERDRAADWNRLNSAIAGESGATKQAQQGQLGNIGDTFCSVYTDITLVPQDLKDSHTEICK